MVNFCPLLQHLVNHTSHLVILDIFLKQLVEGGINLIFGIGMFWFVHTETHQDVSVILVLSEHHYERRHMTGGLQLQVTTAFTVQDPQQGIGEDGILGLQLQNLGLLKLL